VPSRAAECCVMWCGADGMAWHARVKVRSAASNHTSLGPAPHLLVIEDSGGRASREARVRPRRRQARPAVAGPGVPGGRLGRNLDPFIQTPSRRCALPRGGGWGKLRCSSRLRPGGRAWPAACQRSVREASTEGERSGDGKRPLRSFLAPPWGCFRVPAGRAWRATAGHAPSGCPNFFSAMKNIGIRWILAISYVSAWRSDHSQGLCYRFHLSTGGPLRKAFADYFS
jgi:hypothetical protein